MEALSDELEEIHNEVFKVIGNVESNSNMLLDKTKAVDEKLKILKLQFEEQLLAWQSHFNDTISDFQNKYELLKKNLNEDWNAEIQKLQASLNEIEKNELDKFKTEKKIKWDSDLNNHELQLHSKLEEIESARGDLISRFNDESESLLSKSLIKAEAMVSEETEVLVNTLKQKQAELVEQSRMFIDGEQRKIDETITEFAELHIKIDRLVDDQTELSKGWASENERALQKWEEKYGKQLSNLSSEYQNSMETLINEQGNLISKQKELGSNLIGNIKEKSDKIENTISTIEKRCSELKDGFLKDLCERSKSLEEEISSRLKNYDQTLQNSFNLVTSDTRKAVTKLLRKELENQRFYWREFIEKNRSVLERFKALEQSFKVLVTSQKTHNNRIKKWLIVIGTLSFCNMLLFLSSSHNFEYLSSVGQSIVDLIFSFVE